MTANLDKAFSIACERNSSYILEKLQLLLQDSQSVLEIGSGTGQHAVYFAKELDHLLWQTTDLPENHPSIRAWIAEEQLPNVLPPMKLDVKKSQTWPNKEYDAVYSSNTAHIMSWNEVQAMFAGVSQVLVPEGIFCLYGPFNYYGKYTSLSNKQFDNMLRSCEPHQGIRDFADLSHLAKKHHLQLENDFAMPANNRLLQWRLTL